MKTVTPKSFETLKGKPNEARCVSGVSTLVKCKPIIRDESEMDWHKLPESSMREPNEADCAERVGSMTTLVEHKLAIQNVISFQRGMCS